MHTQFFLAQYLYPEYDRHSLTLKKGPSHMHHTYNSPLSTRYASSEMNALFSPQHRHHQWRLIWVTLAKAQRALGLNITQEQIDELETHINHIDFERAEEYEAKFRHDVMAHIHAYGDQCPLARPIIHLGATSCLITDNADILILRDALNLTKKKLLRLIKALSHKAETHKALPCLSWTHFQSGQPSTVGKRLSLYLQDFMIDLDDLDHRLRNLKLLGTKGATGTQASFLDLFDGDDEKVQALERLFATDLDFEDVYPISGQTYTRKLDMQVMDVLCGIATSAHKIATDIRLLAHKKEWEEPFKKNQVGSSAMPYKRNPMQSERVCSLARYVMSLEENPKYTAATQWLERTLDDSANRRLCLPEAFLGVDSILLLLINIVEGLQIYPRVIERNLREDLPFLATERILMASVQLGADRQEVHESLRLHCMEVSRGIKEEGLENDLLDKLANDRVIPLSREDLEGLMDAKAFVGRSEKQVEEFLEDCVGAVLEDDNEKGKACGTLEKEEEVEMAIRV
ncbi:Adenylosuccinate lyase [Chlamydiales bacterium SCGC AG-110-M15]|nr:Adenylosuccinate lyase [Chlamydiales bacterium SCGC AG-110-M15]